MTQLLCGLLVSLDWHSPRLQVVRHHITNLRLEVEHVVVVDFGWLCVVQCSVSWQTGPVLVALGQDLVLYTVVGKNRIWSCSSAWILTFLTSIRCFRLSKSCLLRWLFLWWNVCLWLKKHPWLFIVVPELFESAASDIGRRCICGGASQCGCF